MMVYGADQCCRIILTAIAGVISKALIFKVYAMQKLLYQLELY